MQQIKKCSGTVSLHWDVIFISAAFMGWLTSDWGFVKQCIHMLRSDHFMK